MMPLLVRVIAIVAILLVVIGLSVSFMKMQEVKMQEVPVLKIRVSVTTDTNDKNVSVHVNALKRERMNVMSVPRTNFEEFPAVQAYVAVNMGRDGSQWVTSPYKGAGDYELTASFRSEPEDEDIIMVLVWVVDAKGERISDIVRIMNRWSEIQS